MKKYLFLLLGILFASQLFGAEYDDYKKWQSKTYSEKVSFMEGVIESVHQLGMDIDKQISKNERQKLLSEKTANSIEIPVLVMLVVVGNSQTNGIPSLVNYIDECYSQEIYKKKTIYELLVLASKGTMAQSEQFKWIFED